MFLKQEEWFLNQLKTEILEHLPGHPQMDQQSLKDKVKYSFSIIHHKYSTNVKPELESHQPLHEQVRKGHRNEMAPFLRAQK